MAQTHAGAAGEPPSGTADVVVRRRRDSGMPAETSGSAFADSFLGGFDALPPGPPAAGATVSGPVLDAVVDAVVERIEQRVIDELERRGGRHRWGAF